MARRLGGGDVEARVWERGVGETGSSGTSAVAVAAALGVSPATIHFPGGELSVRIEDGRAFHRSRGARLSLACDRVRKIRAMPRRLAALLLVSAAALAAVAAATATPGKRDPAPQLPGSCWGRVTGAGTITTAASSALPARRVTPSPNAIATSLLARFGDDRFVRRIVIGKPPPITFQHTGYWASARPPTRSGHTRRSPDDLDPAREEAGLADWEFILAEGALRDDFCAARGRPLVGASVGGTTRSSRISRCRSTSASTTRRRRSSSARSTAPP